MRIAVWASFLACVAFAGFLIAKVGLTAMELHTNSARADVDLPELSGLDMDKPAFDECSDLWEAHMLGDFNNVAVVDHGREHEVETASGTSLDDLIRIKSIWHAWNPDNCCVFVYDKISREDRTLRRHSWVGDRLQVLAILPGRVLFNLDGELIVFQSPDEGDSYEPGVEIEDLRGMGLRDEQIRELFPELFEERPTGSDEAGTEVLVPAGEQGDEAEPGILDGNLQEGLDLTITETGWTTPTEMEVTDFDRLEFVERFEEHMESVGMSTRIDMETGRFSGVRITQVPESSRLHTFGWREGDILLEVAGNPIVTPLDLDAFKSAFQPGAVVELVLLREGEQLTLSYTLSVRTPPEGQ